MGEPQKTIYAGQSVAPERTLALTKALLAEADRLKKGGRILRDKIGFIDCGVRWHSLLQECSLADRSEHMRLRIVFQRAPHPLVHLSLSIRR